ncbi:MAG: hypothetical protein OXI27_08410, partial [Thaumarchaeota archaeon]|nr:hypothetical protein [Nitrososphaerota archaeon]
MADNIRPRVEIGLLLAVSVLAAAVPAHAQEQAPALFSAIPEDAQAPPSLDARSAYMVDSEMVVLDTGALRAASVSATMLGDTYAISMDSVETRDVGDYTWFGSGPRVSDAILVVNGSGVSGLIYAQNRTFEILHVSSDVHEVYELDMSRFPPVGTDGYRTDAVVGASGASGATATVDRGQISRLESTYVGWKEYDEDTRTDAVTIDVYVAVTKKAEDAYKGPASRLARLAVDTANRAYQQNDLPVSISLAGHRTIGGYTDAGSVTGDLQNLMNANNPLFARAHAEIARVNADVVVLFVGDYTHKGDDNRDLKNTCGEAHTLLAEDASESFATVESVCVSAHSFTNAIGSLQGAGYNAENETNTEFSYGHGYYHAGTERRTVMSQSHDSCDDLGTNREEVCTRQAIWSDPHRDFFGTATPAGTAEDWNARVVFATAPHIASLRGGAQSYDTVGPTGNVTVPSPVPTSGAMQVNATFSEPIHDW